jgi:phosphatidylserine/phosphatidylglycerophosphate/cardiolipin synthase-like enzyme
MTHRMEVGLIVLILVALAGVTLSAHAHQDSCHRLHRCPSDHNTYVCGDMGRGDRCPDHPYCLAGKPRLAAPPAPGRGQSTPTFAQPPTSGGTTVCFTPGGHCTELMVNAILGAQTSIRVQAYTFTSAPIAKALLEAHKRSVPVQVILDQRQRTEKYSSADFLANQGVPTLLDAAPAIAHHKAMILDGDTVITRSFNKAAQEKNAENVLTIRDQALAAQYTRNWQAHAQHSQRYMGRGVR